MRKVGTHCELNHIYVALFKSLGIGSEGILVRICE